MNFIEREPFADDVVTVRVLSPAQDAFDLARQLVLKRKWEIVALKAPSNNASDAVIEAVDRSLILAAPDDIVIRIRSNKGQSLLDMRSAARYGSYDLGRNQIRVQKFLDDYINLSERAKRVEQGEPLFLPTKKMVP